MGQFSAQTNREAPIAHIYGNLEEVVDAWNEIPELSRASHPLAVGEFRASYDDIFINLERRHQIPNAQFWPQRIYHFEAKLTPGKVAGLFFVRSIAQFDGENGRHPLTTRLRITPDVEAEFPGIANRLADLKTVRVFCHSDASLLSTDGIGSAYALGQGGYVKVSQCAIRAR